MEPLAVRVVYVVPHDADPWPEARWRALHVLEDLQWFFAGEMNRLGYGPKTFQIGYNSEGAFVFNEISSNQLREEFLRDNPGHTPTHVNLCKEAAGPVGLRNTNDVVLYFFEAYSIG